LGEHIQVALWISDVAGVPRCGKEGDAIGCHLAECLLGIAASPKEIRATRRRERWVRCRHPVQDVIAVQRDPESGLENQDLGRWGHRLHHLDVQGRLGVIRIAAEGWWRVDHIENSVRGIYLGDL
jgi:hypothetical protein